MTNKKQLNLIRTCFKNQLDSIETLPIKIKYDKEIIILNDVINDTYHRIYHMEVYGENEIIDAINTADPDITAYYDNKPCYLYIKINNAVNTQDTYCFNQMMDHLKEKYKIVVNTLLKLYIMSSKRSNKL